MRWVMFSIIIQFIFSIIFLGENLCSHVLSQILFIIGFTTEAEEFIFLFFVCQTYLKCKGFSLYLSLQLAELAGSCSFSQ